MYVRIRKDNIKLRERIARLELQAPVQDLLLGLVRVSTANNELLEQLLDSRKETIKVTDVNSPHILHREP